MAKNNKTYGFTIAVKELKETVPNIFRYASAYKRTNNITSQGLWEMFLEDPVEEEKPAEENNALPDEILQTQPGAAGLKDVDPEAMEGETYNMCHFWSNFEIARLDFFRSKAYEDFFTMMDRSGGFWNERVRLCLPILYIYEFLATGANETLSSSVGRCAYPLSCCRRTSISSRHSLLQRFWISSHHHPALPRQCSSQTTRSRSISRTNHSGPEAPPRRGRILGLSRSTQGERRWLPMSL